MVANYKLMMFGCCSVVRSTITLLTISCGLLSPTVAQVAANVRVVTHETVIGNEHDVTDHGVISSFVTSGDSRHIAYFARRSLFKLLVVVDGVEGKAYDGIDDLGIIFSPDGKHVVFVAKQGAV